MKNTLIIAIIMLISVNTAYCATLESEQEARLFADNVMKSVVNGDIKAAFDKLKPYVGVPETEIDSVYLQSKAQRDQRKERIGNTIGYEFIASKRVGQSLFRLIYIEKTEKTIFFWSFYFYQVDKGWMLELFNFGDSLPALFQAV